MDARVQLFIFQQFLIVFLLMPITGAMALAAHAIVGEKQARTLEPLLATPITTGELLVAKVLGALLRRWRFRSPASRSTSPASLLFAAPGVAAAMANLRTLLLIGRGRTGRGARVAADGDDDFVARQRSAHRAAVRRADHHPAHRRCWSRSSPASLWLSAATLALVGARAARRLGCCSCSSSVALFERETILTRWR